jgi:hypothetical protein
MSGYFRAAGLPSLSWIGYERFLYPYRLGWLWDEGLFEGIWKEKFWTGLRVSFLLFFGGVLKNGWFFDGEFVVSLW